MDILRNYVLKNMLGCASRCIIFSMLFYSTYCMLVEQAQRERSERCDNGGFIIENGDGIQNCFCHGTGFYGTHCNIPCPSSYPVECIQV